MFIQQLFEGEIKRVIVIYPGRFQPFHLGHKEVFETLQAKFGMDNVFIGTSNKTDAVKSPFNFSDKLQLMTAAGVNNHHVIEVTSPYMPDDYIRTIGFDPKQTVMIFAVGEPDLKRLEVDANYTALTPTGRPSKIPDGKSVGDPKPFKTFRSLQDSTTADQHQYVLIVNEREKAVEVNGKKINASHGTQVRELWNQVRNDPKASAQVLQQLYGRATPELAHLFNKIPDSNAAPAPAPAAAPKLKAVKQPQPAADLNEFAPPGGDDGNDGFSDETLKRLAAQWWQGDEDPRVEQTLAAAGWEIGQDEGYDDEPGVFVVQAGDINGNSYISWPAQELEGLGEGAIITKDQLVDIYIKGKGKNNMPIQKKVGAQIPNSKVNAFITAVADKYGLNPKAFVYGPSNTMSEDAAGVGVVASKKQKNDPRYSMSLTKDVRPGEVARNMKKLHLEGNRGYNHGFASPTAPGLGRRGREDDEYHVPDPAPSIWYIRADGKIIKDKMGTPFQFRDKEAARKSAMTMMTKPFNAGKKFVLTTRPEDEQGVAEDAEPMDREFALVKKLGRLGERIVQNPKLWDRYDEEINSGDPDWIVSLIMDGTGATSDEVLHLSDLFGEIGGGMGRIIDFAWAVKEGHWEEDFLNPYRKHRQQGQQGIAEGAGPATHRIGLTVTDPNHPMVSKRGETYHKTVRITQDVSDREAAINQAIAHYRRKGYKVHDHHYIGTVDDEPIAEGKRSDTYHIVNKDGKPVSLASYADKESAIKDRDAKHQGAEVRQLGPRGKVKGVSEGSELKQAKRKYNQAAKDANDDQVGAGKKIDTMKKSLRQKDLDNKKQDVEEGATGAKPGWMLKQDPALAKKVKDSKAGHQALKKWAGKPVPKDDKQGVAESMFGIDDKIKGQIQNITTEISDIPGYWDHQRDTFTPYGVEALEKALGNNKKYVKYALSLTSDDYYVDEGGLGLDHKRNRFKSVNMRENAEELSVGDPVIISGQGIEFEGKTGDIDSFGDMKRFVVVNLYNHGKHSFHSSDVSYNDYADREDDLDEDLYQYDKEDPYNSEFAPRAGMGRMTLRGWKQQMIKRTAELAQQMAAAGQDIDKSALWDNVHAKLKSMNMDPIAQEIEQAQAELEKIRQRGGVRSRAFNK